VKKYLFKIFCAVILLLILAYWVVPLKAFFFDKAKIENELRVKNVEKDSLSEVLTDMQNNPDDLEKEARNNGYAKKGETMLKIVPENLEEKSRKLNISLFLIASLIIVSGLIISFAIQRKPDEELCQESTNTPQ